MSFTDNAPHFDLNSARKIAVDLYALDARVSNLPSERDQNFLLSTLKGEFVLKLANAGEKTSILEAQNAVMRHISTRLDFCPEIIPTTTGNDISMVTSPQGTQHAARLVTYLPGKPLGDVQHRSPELLHDLGRKIGQMDSAFKGFAHHALERNFHWDLARGQEIVRQYGHLIQDKDFRKTVDGLTSDFDIRTAPILKNLRRSVIHNDANDYNVLVGDNLDIFQRRQSVVGVIDFGDMITSYTIGNLAVAVAYAILDQPEPLATAATITRGYNQVFPLQEAEISVLFGLVTMRLCMSAAIGAEQQHNEPTNAYLSISQKPIRNTLPILAQIHPRFAEAVLREACGLPPIAQNPAITRWLEAHQKEFAPILETDPSRVRPAMIDLSMSSPLLSSNPEENDEALLTNRIEALAAQSAAKVGLGLYDEARYLYTSPTFATSTEPTSERRCVHMGIDLFAQAGTPVFAPLDGQIAAIADMANKHDYGPVIVLEHKTDAGLLFYSLFGHLSRESLLPLQVGQHILKGQRLATLGRADINGGWTPHLHFQLILDLLDKGCDFPGVARPSQRAVWKSLCPDPNLVLGIPENWFPLTAPEKSETLATRKQRLGGNLSIAYREPVKVVRGWKQYLFDDEGRKYIDAYNNVAHVGHAHPRVVEAGRRQMGILNTNTRYLHDLINQYAEELTRLLPEPLRVCYFVNSGSEANELALRLARAATGQRDLIVLEAAYHGNTNTLIDISPYKHNGPGGLGAPGWVHAVPIPDDYRGMYKRGDPEAGVKYANEVGKAIEAIQQQGRNLAGYIAESLPSVGGQIVMPSGYLAEVYRLVRSAGGVCIADEVQTGFGRVGTHFWGFEMQSVTPDIVVLGKPMGNGHPMGAVVTTYPIAQAFNNGMEYFSTFGGNPVSCAIGLEVLNVVRDEGLQEHARLIGEQMLTRLHPLVNQYDMVGDVRGNGLFLGIELVRSKKTLEPAAEEASFVSNRLREHGVLLGTDGPFHNVIKIRPPMPFDASDAEYVSTVIEKILRQDFG